MRSTKRKPRYKSLAYLFRRLENTYETIEIFGALLLIVSLIMFVWTWSPLVWVVLGIGVTMFLIGRLFHILDLYKDAKRRMEAKRTDRGR